MVPCAAMSIIVVESWLAIAHLTGWWLRLAVPVGFGVFAGFAVAVAINLRRGRPLPCYCFDATGGEPISVITLSRLVLLLSTQVFLLANPNFFTRNGVVHEQIHGVTEFGLAACWVAFLLVAFSWLLTLPELAELLRQSTPRSLPATPTRSASFSGDQAFRTIDT